MENKTKDTITQVIGFDFGHAETAVTKANMGAATQPASLKVQGQTTMVTAVAETGGQVLVGKDAYRGRNPEGLKVAFKSPRLKDPETRRPTKLFIQRIVEMLTEERKIAGGVESLFVVGCPSGWKETVRRDYEELLREAGMQQVRVIAESHAAFLAAREVLDIPLEDLKGSVLIVDIGSSTTDFTAVVEIEEKRIDFGSNELGAGILDKITLERSLKAELRELFEEHPQYRDQCLLFSREVKEAYFNSKNTEETPADIFKRVSEKRIPFDVEIGNGDMDEILSTPVGEYLQQPDEELRGLDWPSAFRRELQRAREKTADNPPQMVLLTGGASQMDFVLKCCEEVFPNTKVVRGEEPQFTIARGLALAGRTGNKLEKFRSEIKEILASDKLRKALREKPEKDEGSPLEYLMYYIADFVVHELSNNIILPAFIEWREGRISTLNRLEREIKKRTRSLFEGLSRAGSQELEDKVVKPWLEEYVRPAVERLIDPICKEAKIPVSELSLSPDFTLPSVNVAAPSDSVDAFDDIDTLGNVTVIIGSIIIATLLGGGGTALLISGPIGWIIGLVIGAVATFVGKEVAMDIIKDSDVPTFLRKMMTSEETVREKLEENEEELLDQIFDALQEKADAFDDLLESIAKGIEADLKEKAGKAEMLIK